MGHVAHRVFTHTVAYECPGGVSLPHRLRHPKGVDGARSVEDVTGLVIHSRRSAGAASLRELSR